MGGNGAGFLGAVKFEIYYDKCSDSNDNRSSFSTPLAPSPAAQLHNHPYFPFMASHSTRTDKCRIYQEEQLQHFNPNQPFSTAGGHADVYRASHAEDGELALKRPRWGTGDLADRFALATREASVWQVLHHPNVLEFLGILYSSPHIYLISPFASHGSLPQYLRAYSDADRPVFISQISSGLAYLHSKDVIHGDVKGANVLVSPMLTAQLCDFGLSKFADTATSTGGKGGSLPWLSPERMDRPDSPRTKESDVYAFGMTIYEILSGLIPFNTLNVDALRIAVCVHDERPPISPEHSNSDTPYTVVWILAEMCWVKQPERRPSMSDSCAFFQRHRIGWPEPPGTEQASGTVKQGQKPQVKNNPPHDSPIPVIPTSSSDATPIWRKRTESGAYDTLQHCKGEASKDGQPSGVAKRLKLHHHREMELDPDHGNTEVAVPPHPHTTTVSPLESFPRVEGLLRAKSASHRSARPNAPSTCLEGTRTAVLEKVYAWAKSTDPNTPRVFWLNGMAGTGKSTIAQTLAEHAEQEGTLGASFFFSRHGEAEVRNADLVIPTLAFQLAHNVSSFIHHLDSAIVQDPDVVHYTRSRQLQLLLAGPLKAVKRLESFVIVLDALDECEGRDAAELLHLVLSMISQSAPPPTLKLFITCRPDPELDSILQRARFHQKFILHDVEEDIIQADIELYLKTGLANLPPPHSLPPDWISPVDLKELVRRSGKLFVYATTTLKYIREYDFDSPQEKLQSVLCTSHGSGENVLGDLDDLYLQVLRAAVALRASRYIEATVKRKAERIQSVLGGIVALRTPLPLKALEGLFGIPSDQITTTLKHLQSIVLLPESPDHAPQFLHQSFPDFLVNPSRCTDERFLIHTTEHDRHLATQCLTMMTIQITEEINTFDIRGVSDDGSVGARPYREATESIAVTPELAYACCFWASHLLNAPTREPILVKQLGQFTSKCIMRWLEVLSLIGQVAVAARAADDAYKWAMDSKCCGQVTSLLHDMHRFVLAHLRCISEDPQNVISCALPFVPSNTSLRKHYQRNVALGIHVLRGIERKWSPCLSVLEGHSRWVETIEFSPDGSRIVSGSGDSTARIWDTTSGQLIAMLEGHSGSVKAVISPDGRCIASGSNGEGIVRIWDTVSGQPIAVLEGHSGSVYTVVFSPDGSRIASGSGDKTVRIWDTVSNQPIAMLEGHSDCVTVVVFSPDGCLIASGSSDLTVAIWDAVSGQPIATLEGQSESVDTIAFSPDSSRIASGFGDTAIRIWDASSGEPVATLEGHSGWVSMSRFSPDGSRIVSGSGDGTIRIWDTISGHPIATLKGHSDIVFTVAFSPDGSRIASGSGDRTIRVWDVASAQHIATFEGHPDIVEKVVFSPDGSRIASCSTGTVRIWDAASRPPIATFDGHSDYVSTIAFSPDGSRIASGSYDRTIRVWDTTSGQPIVTLKGNFCMVFTVIFSPDGSYIASGSDDKTVRIWHAVSGQHITVFEGHSDWVSAIAFSPDSSRIASGSSDKTIRIWDAVSSQPIAVLKGHSSFVLTVVFSPDGSRIVSGSHDSTMRIWTTTSGQLIATLEGHSGHITTIAFSLEDSRIFAWDKSGSLLVGYFSSGVWALEAPSPSDIHVATKLLHRCVGGAVSLLMLREWSRIPSLRVCGAGVKCADVSPDGRIAVIGCASGRILFLSRALSSPDGSL